MPFIKEVRFRDIYTDEDGNVISDLSSIRSIVPGQVYERDQELILHTLISAFSHLSALPALDTLVLNLFPYLTEETFHEVVQPSGVLDFQLGILKALSTNSDALSLTSLTIDNLIAFYNELYDDPSFLQIFSALSRLRVTVVSNISIEGGVPFEDDIIEFWEKAISHRILAPPADSLAGSFAKSLTSLTIHSDKDVGFTPRIVFSGLTYPLLTSLSLQYIFFDDHNDINTSASIGVEDFIVRHRSTLTDLELIFCRILVLDDEGTSGRFWSQIWSHFANELKVLVNLHVLEVMDLVSVLYNRDRILRYARLVQWGGYMPIYEPMAGEANDGPALQALQEVVATRC
ncbi:hypothetical protein EW146_g2381 [Bondarzewia mesenterica]|uniref:Uncharacterized protein n=1 Tax=Bondarzewia mesenterica TaxID=1095465 RepID=A0A4S4M360_9AGAM|nr:hypothetical protein EW146_g2381 [Bondarzewia mesenterica]